MAGGKGVRLNSGEKPLAELKGKPLIAYVIDALLKSPGIGHIYVAVSQWTPGTSARVKEQ